MTDADRVKMLEACLMDLDGLFSAIRDDYTDPRSECREGRRLIALALAAVTPGE